MITKNVPYCYPIKILNNSVFVRIDLFILIPVEAGFQVSASTDTALNPVRSIEKGVLKIRYNLEAQPNALSTYFYHRIPGVNRSRYRESQYICIDAFIGGNKVGDSLYLSIKWNYDDIDVYSGPDTDTKAINSPYIRLNYDTIAKKLLPGVIILNQGTNYHYAESKDDETGISINNGQDYQCKVILQSGNVSPQVPESPRYIDSNDNLFNMLNGGDFIVEVEMQDDLGNKTGKKKGKVKDRARPSIINLDPRVHPAGPKS